MNDPGAITEVSSCHSEIRRMANIRNPFLIPAFAGMTEHGHPDASIGEFSWLNRIE
jgi:hypothetical protein